MSRAPPALAGSAESKCSIRAALPLPSAKGPSRVNRVCNHQPLCPDAQRPDRGAAVIVYGHPEQGWSLLCNGTIALEDCSQILPDGTCVEPSRSGRVA
ncbi:DUF5999 family protein [Streptacidiphilus sp. MAP12-33]|uniref:DUF5999 family protein n=1 Tax=Streptacidiphilus sp. MAP12-33 TaxID=3156266 RepID=UPI003510FAC9